MGKCKYCGKDAGLFHSSHPQCEAAFEQGKNELSSILYDCFAHKTDFYLKDQDMKRITSQAYLNSDALRKLYVSVFDNAIEQYLDDGIIDQQEERVVARYMQYTGLNQETLNTNKSLEKVVQSKVLQDILQGNKPIPRITIKGDFPFMLSKSESIVWLFRNITLHQQKVKREYVGRTGGFSFKVMKGVYYRTGGFKGHPIETTVMQRIDTGNVCLTDKNLYFASPMKSLKIPYNKILSIESYLNGIGIQKDGTNDKPIFLEGLDSWFCYNVIANLK